MNKSMTIALCAAAMATLAHADTITWTGDGDGSSWNDLDNWVCGESGLAPTYVPLSSQNSGDQVVISGSGVSVNYNGGDPYVNASESITVSDGATLVQTVASWWFGENGTVTIDGGTFDTGSCSGTHTWANFNIVNGGKLIARTAIPDANITLDATSAYEMTSNGNFTHTGTEKFTVFTATAQNVELNTDGDHTTFASDIVWTCKLFSAPALQIAWEAGSLVTWDTTFGGYYNGGGTIDIAEGWTGSFTFAYTPMSVFTSCIENKFTYNGEALTAARFEELFSVTATTVTDPEGNVHSASRVAIAAASDWKIGAVSAESVSASGATISAEISQIVPNEEYSVYVAYGTAEITDANIVSLGEEIAESEGACSKILTGLAENSVYNFGFAIVTNNAVAAFKGGTFVASDYDFVYDNGWVGGRSPANLAGGTESALFLSDFTTAGEFSLTNKRIQDSVFTSGTMLFGTADVANSALVNTRSHALNQTPYGIYAAAYALNFISASGSGIFRRACSYTFRAIDTQMEAFFTENIENGKIRVSGETLSAADYASLMSLETIGTETGTYDYGDGEGPVEKSVAVATLTLWDVLHASDTGDWTLKDGARVRLAGKARIGALSIEPGADAKIDLNGNALVVSSLALNGENLKGTFTSATLPTLLIGEGTLSVGRAPTLIMVH